MPRSPPEPSHDHGHQDRDMSRRKYPPCYSLARALEDTIFRAGISAYAIHASRPADADALMRQCDKLEAIYTSERGEHYSETIKRGPTP